jgi:uncharacterized membrane-anchored protein YitT (DUF2179 family)
MKDQIRTRFIFKSLHLFVLYVLLAMPVAFLLTLFLFPAHKEVASDGTTDQAQFAHLYNKVLPSEPSFYELMT